MTPREEASKLIVNYQLKCKSLDYQQAKECALIAVDEILNSWYPVNIHSGYEFNHDNLTTSFNEYWEQVKEEIKKL